MRVLLYSATMLTTVCAEAALFVFGWRSADIKFIYRVLVGRVEGAIHSRTTILVARSVCEK